MTDTQSNTLEPAITDALRTVFDPEIPVNIHDLGLIYGIDISDTGEVVVRMTLTAPNCPMAGVIVMQVEAKVKAVEGVTGAKVELVWDPPWTPDRMTEAAKLDAGIFGMEDEPSNKLRVLGNNPARKWKP